MNILVDENIPRKSVRQLRGMANNVLDVRGTAAEGSSDEALWNKALAEKCLLITTDRGFAHYRDKEHFGILIVLLRKPNCHKICDRVIAAVRRFPPEEWPGLLVVMRDNAMSTWRASSDT